MMEVVVGIKGNVWAVESEIEEVDLIDFFLKNLDLIDTGEVMVFWKDKKGVYISVDGKCHCAYMQKCIII